MYELMSRVNWDEVIQCLDPNTACRELHISRRKFPQWFSSDTIRKIKQKEQAHRNYKNFKTESYHLKYVALRADVKTRIDIDYRVFISNAANSIRSDPPTFGITCAHGSRIPEYRV
nr:unnamed protein product [Callosobruchus chinensis]